MSNASQGLPTGVGCKAGDCGAASTASENLAEAARRVEAESPWYEKVGLVWNEDGGSGRDVAALVALNLADTVFKAANETVLAPVFVVVKGLLDAMHGAAAAREELVELVKFCVAITRCLLEAAQSFELPPSIVVTVGEFKGEVEAVGGFVQTYGTQAGCCRKMATNARDRDAAAGHKRRLDDLLSAIMAGLAIETFKNTQTIADWAPPVLDDLAAVPCEAPSLPRSHVPRAGMLEQIVLGLLDPRRGSPAVHGLVGMGGGGKTVLASSVVRDDRVRSSFNQGMFWVCVGQAGKDNIALLLKQLAREMAAAASNTPHTCPDGFDSAEEAERHLKEVLARNQLRCLLVLDGVWDVEVVNAFARTGFHLLVTTRRRAVIAPPHEGTMVEIGEMSQEDALQVLGKASKAQGPLPVEAEQVARDCGMLPLALGMAGAMARRQPLQAAAWRRVHEILQKRNTELREMQSEHETLFSTIEASANELPSSQQKQLRLMAVMASGVSATSDMLASLWEVEPDDVTTGADILVDRCLLQPVAGGAEYALDDLVLRYLQLAIKMDDDLAKLASSRQASFLGRADVLNGYAAGGGGGGGDATVTNGGMYALVALWNSAKKLDDTLSAEEYYKGSLEGATEPDPWSAAGQLLHLLGNYRGAELMYTTALKMAQDKHPESEGVASALVDLARVQHDQGKHEIAERLETRAAGIHGRIDGGGDHRKVAADLSNQVASLKAQGKHAEALELNLQLIETRESALGPDHPDLAKCLSDQVDLLGAQRRYAEAEGLSERVQDILEKALGPEHPDVAESLYSRAGLKKAQGKYREAEALYARGIAILERALGGNHLRVAAGLKSMAKLLKEQKKFAEAEPLFKRAETIRVEKQGPDHPGVAEVLGNRAQMLVSQARYSEAEPLIRRAQEILERSGQDQRDLATVLNVRAGILTELRNYAAAGTLHGRVAEIREKVFGPQHPTVAAALDSQAFALGKQGPGHFAQAEHLYKRSLAIFKAYDPESPDVASSLTNRAVLLGRQATRYAEADLLYQQSLAIREKVQGPWHLDTASTLNHRANLWMDQGKFDKAEPLLERTRLIREKVLGPDHLDVAAVLNNLAAAFHGQGKHEAGVKLMRRVIAIKERNLPPDHPTLPSALNNLAEMLKDHGKLDEADHVRDRALAIAEKVLGPNHPELAGILNGQAESLRLREKYDDALPINDRALKIMVEAYGKDHPRVASMLNNRALLLLPQFNYCQSIPLLEGAAIILLKTVGERHPNTVSTVSTLQNARNSKRTMEVHMKEEAAKVSQKGLRPDHPEALGVLNLQASWLFRQGQYDDAQPLFERALALTEKSLGSHHPDTVSCRSWLARTYTKQGLLWKASQQLRGMVVSRERLLGRNHRTVAEALDTLAVSLCRQGKYTEAVPLLERAAKIFEKLLGKQHSNVVHVRQRLQVARQGSALSSR